MNTPTQEQKDLIASFIPTIEGMIVKEEAHLASLRKARKRLSDTTMVDKFIENTQYYLDHYKMRLLQYQQYAK